MTNLFVRSFPGAVSLLLVLVLGSVPAPASGAAWLTDLTAAKEQAGREHKKILLNFTGSDWCGWCKKLKAEVFDQAEFQGYADKNLVLLEVDFPHHKPISDSQRRANEALAQQYKIRGFPTLIVLDAAGVQIGETGYHPGGAKTLISQLDQMAPSSAAATAAAGAAGKDKEKAQGGGGLFPWLTANARDPQKQAAEIKLKGISGSARHRMALINSETLAEGEDARILVGGKSVRVQCVEIRPRSVLIRVDNEENPRELSLPAP